MSNVFFISDLHLGHKAILQFAPSRGGTSVEEHDEWLMEQWNHVVQKRDVVWVLGDVAFTKEALPILRYMKGQKHLILGNHDRYPLDEYLKYFAVIRPGLWRYKRMWLSHCPIHPAELRGLPNVHGHVHNATLDDPRYFNACVENVQGVPILLQDLHRILGVEVLK